MVTSHLRDSLCVVYGRVGSCTTRSKVYRVFTKKGIFSRAGRSLQGWNPFFVNTPTVLQCSLIMSKNLILYFSVVVVGGGGDWVVSQQLLCWSQAVDGERLLW